MGEILILEWRILSTVKVFICVVLISTGNSAFCFKIKFLAQDLFLMRFNQLCPKFSTFSPFKLIRSIILFSQTFSEILIFPYYCKIPVVKSSRLEDPNSQQVLTSFKRRSYVRPFFVLSI